MEIETLHFIRFLHIYTTHLPIYISMLEEKSKDLIDLPDLKNAFNLFNFIEFPSYISSYAGKWNVAIDYSNNV